MAGQPYVTKLGDGRYLALELPEGAAELDPITGELILLAPAIRLLDQLRALLSPLLAVTTPGRLRILREGLNLSQEELAVLLKIEASVLAAWEAGQAKPTLEQLNQLEEIRQRAARAGVVVPVRAAG